MKKNKVTFYISEKNENILNKQATNKKSEYMNNSITLYSILEKQLPKVIIELLIKHPDEITLSYFLNDESSLNNYNTLASIDKINPPLYDSINTIESNSEYNTPEVIKEDEEVIKNLRDYL